MNGETLWSRKDVPRGCELLGDDELIFAADAKERVVHVLRMMDGERMGRRPMPELSWILTAGRNVARAGTKEGLNQSFVSVVDIESGKVLWEANYHPKSAMTVVEPNFVAVYEPTGKFQLIDIQSSKVVIDQSLEAYPRLQNIRADVAGDELVLAISSTVQMGRHVSLGPDFAPVDGLIYAFNLKSGQPLWPAPAVVHERFLAMAAPPGLPFIVFAERESQRDIGGGSSKLRLLCLDKRTGQSVYRNDDLPDTQNGQFRIRSEGPEPNESQSSGRVMAIETSSREIRLTATDAPRPPEPPAQDDLVATREFPQRGLSGVGRRIGRCAAGGPEREPGQRASR